jgi:hypothetical protein
VGETERACAYTVAPCSALADQVGSRAVETVVKEYKDHVLIRFMDSNGIPQHTEQLTPQDALKLAFKIQAVAIKAGDK